jgi:hypothetical protein
MTLTVREMTLAETGMIIDYFQGATPEYLEISASIRRACQRRKAGVNASSVILHFLSRNESLCW